MTVSLSSLARHGEISWLSYYFAEFIAGRDRSSLDDIAGLSAALVCEASLEGNVCIELDRFSQRPLFRSTRLQPLDIPHGPGLAAWQESLAGSSCVGLPKEAAPLTLDGKRLYLNRYWRYEDFVARSINARLVHHRRIDSSTLGPRVRALFGDSAVADPHQVQAVATAAGRSFSVISGGPGSGKTSTVVRILALLLTLEPGCRIALAAPTGKAAARMLDSIRASIDRLDVDAGIRQAIPREAHTIHRLLGYAHHGFVYNETNPLALDCLVIDEASMIDLALTRHLLAALPAEARLILIGDRDQLASVAAGNVLGDITGHGLDAATAPVAESIALLRNSYRFDKDSAIAELAQRVNRGEGEASLDLLRQNARGLQWHQTGQERLEPAALAFLCDAFQPVFDRETPAEALTVFESIRILTCTNLGPLGADAINALVSREMLARNRFAPSELFRGLPIMITRNQHDLGLFNGDTGILWDDGDGLRAHFRTGDGATRAFSLYRLPRFTPAWASTVHKSQGSEFDTVFLLLPADSAADILSRELFYTAITRARRRFILHGPDAAAVAAIGRITRRRSGLASKLGWPEAALADSDGAA